METVCTKALPIHLICALLGLIIGGLIGFFASDGIWTKMFIGSGAGVLIGSLIALTCNLIILYLPYS